MYNPLYIPVVIFTAGILAGVLSQSILPFFFFAFISITLIPIVY